MPPPLHPRFFWSRKFTGGTQKDFPENFQNFQKYSVPEIMYKSDSKISKIFQISKILESSRKPHRTHIRNSLSSLARFSTPNNSGNMETAVELDKLDVFTTCHTSQWLDCWQLVRNSLCNSGTCPWHAHLGAGLTPAPALEGIAGSAVWARG